MLTDDIIILTRCVIDAPYKLTLIDAWSRIKTALEEAQKPSHNKQSESLLCPKCQSKFIWASVNGAARKCDECKHNWSV